MINSDIWGAIGVPSNDTTVEEGVESPVVLNVQVGATLDTLVDPVRSTLSDRDRRSEEVCAFTGLSSSLLSELEGSGDARILLLAVGLVRLESCSCELDVASSSKYILALALRLRDLELAVSLPVFAPCRGATLALPTGELHSTIPDRCVLLVTSETPESSLGHRLAMSTETSWMRMGDEK